ncbi:MAG TPA: hypothetical protein PKV71_03205 [Calditrichia bacterium]|nr:hypothetical protein [Calditrichia bacterium]
MRPFLRITLLLVLSQIFFFCSKDSTGPGPEKPESASRNVFSAPAKGHTSKFVYFLGYQYFSTDTTQSEYLPDTLIVSVLDSTAGGFLIRETYSAKSRALLNIRQNGSDPFHWVQDTLVEYTLTLSGDFLTITPGNNRDLSSLLFGWIAAGSSIRLPMAELADERTTLRDWRVSFPYCECYRQGYLEDASILNSHFDRLNVIMDDQAMAFDGPGYTRIFSREAGLVRTYTVSWWTQSAQGWDWLE